MMIDEFKLQLREDNPQSMKVGFLTGCLSFWI